MSRLKYIMVDDPMVGPTPYIFPEWVTHSDVARKIGHRVLSAGFFSCDELNGPVCSDRSTSLGVESRPEDTQIMKKLFDIYG